MVFFRMALRNVTRNWNRTGMILIGMMAASALMTVTTALSTGYAEGAALAWRQMTGADILVYPNRFIFGDPGGAGVTWQWRRLDPDLPTDALFFHPALADGYLSPADARPAVFDPSRLPAAISATPGVVEVQPARLMTAYAVLEAEGGTVRVPVTLRGRDIDADISRWGIPETVGSGRYFRPAQDGEWVALVNGAGFGRNAPKTGGRLVLEVPRVKGLTADGLPILDFAHPATFYFLVYGQYTLPLGTVRLETAGIPNADTAERPVAWPVAIDKPEVWVPAGTFDRLSEALAGGVPFRTRQLGVTVATMAEAKAVAAALGAKLPGCTVVTVPQEVALSGIGYRARLTSLDPFEVVVLRQYFPKAAMAMDVKSRLAVMSFAVAGLLVVANMHLLVSQRRREVGVLKAIGAGRRDILTLFLTEAVGYSLVGSLLGFLAVRLITLASVFSSRASAIEGALLTLRAGGLVVGLTVGTAVLFGFLPAWEAARTPSATLLGDS